MTVETTESATAPYTTTAVDTPSIDGRAQARRENAALKALRAPVEPKVRLGCVLGALGALCTVVPFAGLAELGALLLAPARSTRAGSCSSPGWSPPVSALGGC